MHVNSFTAKLANRIITPVMNYIIEMPNFYDIQVSNCNFAFKML